MIDSMEICLNFYSMMATCIWDDNLSKLIQVLVLFLVVASVHWELSLQRQLLSMNATGWS